MDRRREGHKGKGLCEPQTRKSKGVYSKQRETPLRAPSSGRASSWGDWSRGGPSEAGRRLVLGRRIYSVEGEGSRGADEGQSGRVGSAPVGGRLPNRIEANTSVRGQSLERKASRGRSKAGAEAYRVLVWSEVYQLGWSLCPWIEMCLSSVRAEKKDMLSEN